MKRILALILLISGLSVAQVQTPLLPHDMNYKTSPFMMYNDNGTAKYYAPSFMHDTLYSKTLSGASDTVKFNFLRNYLYGFVTAVDSNDSNTDSLQVFYKSSLTGKLTSQMIALRDMSSYDLVSDNTTLVPGQGIEKQYMIVRPYPGEVWITWKTKSGKTTRRCLISFLGKGY